MQYNPWNQSMIAQLVLHLSATLMVGPSEYIIQSYWNQTSLMHYNEENVMNFM